MPESELLAIAAHLHVLLRRSCGRVTDTESVSYTHLTLPTNREV